MNADDVVRVSDAHGFCIVATVIKIWSREEAGLTGRQQNSSSGPGAFTFQLGARAVFERNPGITRVMLISTRAPMVLYLYELAGEWRDVNDCLAIVDAVG